MAGVEQATRFDTIQYITFATTGNSTDFGDLTYVFTWAASVSNGSRGVVVAGNIPSSPNNTNAMSFVEIASTGQGSEFGQLYTGLYGAAGCSDSSGGLTE